MDGGFINFSINSYLNYSNYREFIYSREFEEVVLDFIENNRLIDKNKFREIFNRFFRNEELTEDDFEDLKAFFGYKEAIENIYSKILNDYSRSANIEPKLGYGSYGIDFYHDEIIKEFLYSISEELKYRRLKQEIVKVKNGVGENLDLVNTIGESRDYEILNINGTIYIYNKREKVLVPDEFTLYEASKRKKYSEKSYIFVTAKSDFLVNIKIGNGVVILYSLGDGKEILRGKDIDIRLDDGRTIIKYEENGDVKYFYIEGKKFINSEEGFDIFFTY